MGGEAPVRVIGEEGPNGLDVDTGDGGWKEEQLGAGFSTGQMRKLLSC